MDKEKLNRLVNGILTIASITFHSIGAYYFILMFSGIDVIEFWPIIIGGCLTWKISQIEKS